MTFCLKLFFLKKNSIVCIVDIVCSNTQLDVTTPKTHRTGERQQLSTEHIGLHASGGPLGDQWMKPYK